jgi:SAM-dependent methyltransferase
LLARLLSDRCGTTVGVDPDAAVLENPFFKERYQVAMEQFESAMRFDLVTMRMVAEHVEKPRDLIASFKRCTQPDSLVVVYTVNAWSPVPIVTRIVPFALHNPVKRVLWGTEAKDTFPTVFQMNTRRTLRRLFAEGGFEEQSFAYLDDCRTFGQFRVLLTIELLSRRILRAVRLPYPENCLLGVYRRL